MLVGKKEKKAISVYALPFPFAISSLISPSLSLFPCSFRSSCQLKAVESLQGNRVTSGKKEGRVGRTGLVRVLVASVASAMALKVSGATSRRRRRRRGCHSCKRTGVCGGNFGFHSFAEIAYTPRTPAGQAASKYIE